MNYIGVVGRPSRRRFQIINKLEGANGTRVQIFSDLEEVSQWLDQSRLSGLILVEEEFEDHHIELMDNIAHNYPQLVILALVSKVNQAQREEFQRYDIPRCTVLDINYELKDLKGVVERMIRGDQVSLRTHYRYTVSKRAHLLTKNGPFSRIHIVDISAGGLQAKGFGRSAQKGERVQIKVPKDSGKGSHMIIGHVAWVNDKGNFGVKFEQVLSRSNPSFFIQSA